MKLADKLAFPAQATGAPGMTLREYYSGLALQGMASDENRWGYDEFQNIDATDLAYAAMLAADSLISMLEANPEAPE